MDARPDKCATGEASLATIAAFALVKPLARLFGRWASQRNRRDTNGAHLLPASIDWPEGFPLHPYYPRISAARHESWPRAGDLVPLTMLEHSFVSAT
jgi:hypothetical protein